MVVIWSYQTNLETSNSKFLVSLNSGDSKKIFISLGLTNHADSVIIPLGKRDILTTAKKKEPQHRDSLFFSGDPRGIFISLRLTNPRYRRERADTPPRYTSIYEV